MRLPVIRGLIDRRILVNYRVEPDVLATLLPAPFRPQEINRWGMAGICLIRLRDVRPGGWPAWVGIRSENAAHRIAVEWDEAGEVRRGVYVLRRDSDSLLNILAGGRLFPGVHHRARFVVREQCGRYAIRATSFDRGMSIEVDGHKSDVWPAQSVFESVKSASDFFEAGSVGYSPAAAARRFDGLELRCDSWAAQPLAVNRVQSSLFDDHRVFPPGAVQFDCALVMRGIQHEWHELGDLCCARAAEDCAAGVPF
jgi:hypothetical protein